MFNQKVKEKVWKVLFRTSPQNNDEVELQHPILNSFRSTQTRYYGIDEQCHNIGAYAFVICELGIVISKSWDTLCNQR